jgi:hypothetical protein
LNGIVIMAESIVCPSCGEAIEVTEVLSAQLRTQIRREFESELRSRESDFTKREGAIKSQTEALAAERSAIDEEIAQRLKAEQQKLAAAALAKAREEISLELKDVQSQLTESRGRLEQAQQAELQLRKERRELEEQKKTLELDLTRQLDKERQSIRETAKREAGEEHRLKEAEKEEMIRGLREQIEVLKQKSEQGSQQLQGEVLELDLEAILRREFPIDEIKPVPKGMPGSDIIHLVRDGAGGGCGTIIWELKRTKNWSDTWLPKLRNDQRAANACLAILVSDELPRSIDTFAFIEGIWVTNRACCVGLALALRCGLLDVSAARRAVQGQHGKMEALYNYLSSTAFKNRITGIVEAFVTMEKDLAEEKRAITARWAKREKQIHQARTHTSGMYGDLQGIIGGNLQVVESLEFPALPSPDGEESEIESEPSLLPR